MNSCPRTRTWRWRPRRQPATTRRNSRRHWTSRDRRPQPAQELTARTGARTPVKTEVAAALSLLSASAVRQRAQSLLAIGLEDGLAHFRIDLARLDEAADLSSRPRARRIRISRCRSTRAGVTSWWAGTIAGRQSKPRTAWHDAAERPRAAFDLAITSVLLDAGAGPQWSYRDAGDRDPGCPLRGVGARKPGHVRQRCVFGAASSRRCAPMPRCWKR